jgi:hypothetical protein
MRSLHRLLPLAFLAGCANACAISKALYVAVVHNSGAPPRAERARIDARQLEFLRDLPNRRVVILPFAILGKPARYDTTSSKALADALRANGASLARDTSLVIPLPLEAQPNEAVILWSRFQALADSVRQHPVSGADYVMQVDVIGNPDRSRIGAVHVLVVTGAGEMAYRRLWNSHQEMFKEFKPAIVPDAVRMVTADLARGGHAP